MKQQKTRELLITTKVAKSWNGEFDQRVDELMTIVSKVDSIPLVNEAAEVLDVYCNQKHKPKKNCRKKASGDERPFEFLVFRN